MAQRINTSQTPAVESWQTPTFQNGWENLGAEWQTARYTKTPQGVVHIQGLVRNGIANTIFTLPSGYRPNADLILATFSGSSAARINVRDTGVVEMSTGGTSGWISINCSFLL